MASVWRAFFETALRIGAAGTDQRCYKIGDANSPFDSPHLPQRMQKVRIKQMVGHTAQVVPVKEQRTSLCNCSAGVLRAFRARRGRARPGRVRGRLGLAAARSGPRSGPRSRSSGRIRGRDLRRARRRRGTRPWRRTGSRTSGGIDQTRCRAPGNPAWRGLSMPPCLPHPSFRLWPRS
jgi:hypothetical protein